MRVTRLLISKIIVALAVAALFSLAVWQTYRGLFKYQQSQFLADTRIHVVERATDLHQWPTLTQVQIQAKPSMEYIYLERFNAPKHLKMHASSSSTINASTYQQGNYYELWQKFILNDGKNLWVWRGVNRYLMPIDAIAPMPEPMVVRTLKHAQRIWGLGENCSMRNSTLLTTMQFKVCQNLIDSGAYFAQSAETPQALDTQLANLWEAPPQTAQGIIGLPAERHFAYALTWAILSLMAWWIGRRMVAYE